MKRIYDHDAQIASTERRLFAAEAGIDQDGIFRELIYYSFVTLSTLGYGDTLPVHTVAQSWAAVEAMIGQFFIAIVIARLVSVYTVEEEESANEDTFPR